MLEPVCLCKARKGAPDIFICPFLRLEGVYFKKYILYIKTPGEKTKNSVEVTGHKQQDWNMGIPSQNSMPKLNILKYMVLQ